MEGFEILRGQEKPGFPDDRGERIKMALNFGNDMFKNENQYDDNGSLSVNSATHFMRAKVTTSFGGTGAHTLINVYDMNSATECLLGGGGAVDNWIKWEFQGKPYFKSIVASFRADFTSATVTCTIDGSNDNSAWTVLGTATFNADGSDVAIASNVSYKYIRARAVSTTAGGVWLTDIMGATS